MEDRASEKLPPGRHAERLTERRNPRTTRIDRVSIEEALAMMHAEDRACVEAVEAVAPHVARAVRRVVEAFRAGGRLIYVGAGTSGRLGVLDAAEQPPTFGVPPEMVRGIIAGGEAALRRSIEGAEDDPDAGARSVRDSGVGANDVVMGLTTGGRAPFVLGALREARILGAGTILLTCTPPLEGEEGLADCQIHVLVGPEAITGSTRLKAGTATKLILNQITTLAMIQMGKVFENLMVDLKPVNAKLRDRSRRILESVAGIESAQAAALLESAGGELKVAIIMALARCGAEEARKTLSIRGGQVTAAIRTILNS
jgi:N-acetylmuramic acid 6-phosphate etherase